MQLNALDILSLFLWSFAAWFAISLVGLRLVPYKYEGDKHLTVIGSLAFMLLFVVLGCSIQLIDG